MSPAEFGSYALVITFVTFVLALQRVAQKPYSVLSASRVGEAYKSYVTSVALAQVGGAAGVTLVLPACGLWGCRSRDSATVAALAAIAGPTIAGWALQEFIRQVL